MNPIPANDEIIGPLLRYFGGKWMLADWIISQFPRHEAYVEPFGGGASVLLRKPRSKIEIYNDIDGELVNLFRVARDNGDELIRALDLTPYAREEFEQSLRPADNPVEQARRTMVRSYFGFGNNITASRKDGIPCNTGFRTHQKAVHNWHNLSRRLPPIITRLQGVILENRDALKLMTTYDGPETLHYVDPPYPHQSRGVTKGYRHEMTDDDHARLAECLHALKGKVALSGYNCPLYRSLYGDWRRLERKTYAFGARKRTEVLWMNYAAEPDLLAAA